jgi:ADP-ribosylglycohydrolase
MDPATRELASRFLPVVIGARVGDAMGAPSEGLSAAAIEERFGWIDTFEGDGTDDSLMASFLADALLASGGDAGVDEWAAEWVAQRDRMLAKADRFFPSVLHIAEKLRFGVAPRRVAAGTMASSSSAMCIWPVGLVNAGNPRAAADQAYALAALIHVGEVDVCQDGAAAVAAAVAVGLRPDADIGVASADALGVLHPTSGSEMRDLIVAVLELADDADGFPGFRDRFHATFHRPLACDARETVPAAFGLATLARGDLRLAVEFAANLGRDTDTIATMTGAVCGAVGGPDAIPAGWIGLLGPDAVADATSLAARLAALARAKAAERVRLARTVPGLVDGLSVHERVSSGTSDAGP